MGHLYAFLQSPGGGGRREYGRHAEEIKDKGRENYLLAPGTGRKRFWKLARLPGDGAENRGSTASCPGKIRVPGATGAVREARFF
jgi:hypothetical protein